MTVSARATRMGPSAAEQGAQEERAVGRFAGAVVEAPRDSASRAWTPRRQRKCYEDSSAAWGAGEEWETSSDRPAVVRVAANARARQLPRARSKATSPSPS